MLHNVTYNPSVSGRVCRLLQDKQFAASWGRKSNRWVIENISRISSCQVQKNPLSLLFVRHWQPFWLRQELSKSSFVRFKPAYFVGQTEPKIHFLGGKWSIMFCSRSAEMNYEKMSRPEQCATTTAQWGMGGRDIWPWLRKCDCFTGD